MKNSVWTGAVGNDLPVDSPSAGWSRKALSNILRKPGPISRIAGAVDLALFAAAEWASPHAEAARGRLVLDLAASARQSEGPGWKNLAESAVTAKHVWDVHALTQEPLLKEIGIGLMEHLLRNENAWLGDAAPRTEAVLALAFLRANACCPRPDYLAAADRMLSRLTDGSAPDAPLNGGPARSPALAEHAWSILALTESFLTSGHRPHREAAEELLRELFQELWDRERGGFMDPSAAAGSDRLVLHENAVALEGAWRLSELKGNKHYSDWAAWGIKGLWSKLASPREARLARVWELLSRGRMDFELVAKPEDRAPLLAALNRHYLPRKIISFVHPDDQDYLQAHKLLPCDRPTLFACKDLRPVARADAPKAVAALVETLRKAHRDDSR
jgi:uncharacterized protein YyaL (SSP411 family)